jgi:hypothetical protein
MVSHAIVVLIVRIQSGPAAIEFHRARALRHLLVETFEQLLQGGVVESSTDLTGLGHSDDHSFDHLGLFGFADLQGVHCGWILKS